MDCNGGYQRPEYNNRRGMRQNMPMNQNNFHNRQMMYNRGGFMPQMQDDSCNCNMQRRCCKASVETGCLEEHYPIAMGYVPMQEFKDLYCLEEGLDNGTIFCQLDLPFVMSPCYTGRCN